MLEEGHAAGFQPSGGHHLDPAVAVEIRRDRLEGVGKGLGDDVLAPGHLPRIAGVLVPDNLVRHLPHALQRSHAEGHDDIQVTVAAHVHRAAVRGLR